MDLRSNRSRSHTPSVQNKVNHDLVSEYSVEESVVQHSYSTRNKSHKSVTSVSSDEVFVTPTKQKSEKAARKVRNRTSDYSSEEGENEITSSKPDAQDIQSQSSYTILSSNGQTKTALQLYQEAGEYWNKYPKTDYTYSVHSKDRVEVAPGVIAMPNMSRRSLRRSMEPTPFEPARRSSYAQDYSDTEEVVSSRYSYTNTIKPKALFRDAADSGKHVKATRVATSSFWQRTSSATRSVFTRTVSSVLWVLYVVYRAILSAVLWCGRGYYKTVSRILLLDTWLLQKSSQRKQWGSLIALILLPLLVLTGWWLCAGLSNALRAALLAPAALDAPAPPLPETVKSEQAPIVQPAPTLNVDEIVSLILNSPAFEHIVSAHLVSKASALGDQERLVAALRSEVTSIHKQLADLSTSVRQESARTKAQLLFEMNRCCRRQYVEIEAHVRRILADLLGLQGTQLRPEAISSWLNTIFVAKQDLEARISEATQNLHADFEHLVAATAAKIMKDVSDKISAKLQERVEASSYSIGVDSALTDSQVHRIVKDALAVYDADKTGLVDYALEPAGGQILSTRCTESYNRGTAVVSVFGIPVWYLTSNPRTVITPGVTPGECWSFQNFPGFLVIQLSARVNISAFSLEHIPRSLAAGGRRESAPKGFSVWALQRENDPEPWQLGAYEYDLDGPSLQFFPVQTPASPADIVELRINSNHGHMNYTCVYRFRVHGNLAEEPT